jgi:hypothetical protein
MPNGFGAVPEELRFTAVKIGDVIDKVAGAVWQGPSGDYGHAGVQAGWAGFIEEMRGHVESLRDNADGHGRGLVAAAESYVDGEAGATGLIGEAAALLESLGGPADSAVSTEMPTGFLHSSIAQRLNPDGS